MTGDSSSCVVRGCVSTRKVSKFIFPRDENIGRQWLNALNIQHLNQLPYQDLRRKKLTVCYLHFDEGTYHKTGDGRHRLIWNSVPSLNLGPHVDLSETMDYNTSSDHGSFSSISESSSMDIEMNQNGQCNDLESTQEVPQCTLPDVPLPTDDEINDLESTQKVPQCTLPDVPLTTDDIIRNYEVSSKRKDQLLEKQHNVILQLKQQLAKERRNNRRQNIKIQKLVAELRKSQHAIKHLRKMSGVQKNFMQMLSQDKNGRRKYLFEEKVLALSVYKKKTK